MEKERKEYIQKEIARNRAEINDPSTPSFVKNVLKAAIDALQRLLSQEDK